MSSCLLSISTVGNRLQTESVQWRIGMRLWMWVALCSLFFAPVIYLSLLCNYVTLCADLPLCVGLTTIRTLVVYSWIGRPRWVQSRWSQSSFCQASQLPVASNLQPLTTSPVCLHGRFTAANAKSVLRVINAQVAAQSGGGGLNPVSSLGWPPIFRKL